MDVTLKKNIEERQKDLKHLELLIAAGRADVVSVEQLIANEADVNFTDKDQNTALHYAVRSDSLDVVQFLLDRVKDTDTENRENETPLDIASRLPNKSIINALGGKVVKKSFRLLEEIVDSEADESALINTNDVLTKAEIEIRKTEDKIKYCLEAIDKLKISNDSEEKLSYEQANVLIYFIEAFSLEGSGDEVKGEVTKYFSQFYKEEDRERISDARKLLFQKPDKKIRLDDVRKFIDSDIKSFFETLKMYVQCVFDKLGSRNHSTETDLSSFFKVLEKKDRDLGEKIDDTRSFLRTEFEKIIRAAYGKQKIKSEELFSFTMNFYPAFKKETNSDFEELRDMRNKLIHEFHKYGNTEFGNAIYSLRSRLFKYYYAQEVLKITSSILPDENPETISRNLKRKLEKFNEQFKTGYGTEQVISQEDAKGSLGYVFSHSLFLERDDSVEYLVCQYLKFMIITDSENKKEYDLSDTDREEEIRFDPSETDHKEKPVNYQKRELRDVDRRDIFEKFCRLQRIKNYCSEGYGEEKQKLRDELTIIYGINGNHFDKVCSSYLEQNSEFNQRDKNTVEEITKIISTLKKIKDNYKLSNQFVISLFDRLFGKQGFSVIEENQSVFRELDQRTLQEIKNEFPRDKTLEVSVENETFRIRMGKIVSNMLKTFYNTYHKYQVEFNVEEIFHDDIFLDYLVRTELKEKDISEVPDSHFHVLAFICSRKQKEKKNAENHDDVDVRELFGIFESLKKCREHLGDQDYKKKKEMFQRKILDKSFWFNVLDFEKLCALFIEKDNEFDELERKEVEKVKEMIKNLKSIGFSWQVIKTLCEKLLDGKGVLNLEDLSFLKNSDMSRKIKVKKQLELYADDLVRSVINMSFGNESINVQTYTVVATMIGAFNKERNVKNLFFTYMVIKKLLAINYCAPYIVKLITEIKNDDVIETNDLLKLMDVLLKQEDGLFIKHLHALLSIRNGKLNLHEELCKKMFAYNINIEDIRIILKEPDHLKEILNIMKEEIELPCNSEKKIVDFIKNIIKLLNTLALEMCRNLNYDTALKILSEADNLQKTMLEKNLMEKTDLHLLETKFQIGKIKNILGAQEPKKSNKVKFYEEALNMFYNIYTTLKYKEISGEDRQIKSHEMTLFLLVLSEIAYTKQLLEKYEDSCAESENLCQAVVRFVLDLPKKKNSRSNDFLNAQTFSVIEKSKNYQELLNFSEESKKYLDVLNIKGAVAFSKGSQGMLEATNKNFSEAMKYYYEALTIYKAIYGLRTKYTELVSGAIIRTMKSISFICMGIAYVWLKTGNAQNAVKFNYLALQKENKMYESMKDIFWSNHLAVSRTRKRIVRYLRCLANAYSGFGRNVSKEEENQFLEKSLEIYEDIYIKVSRMYGEKYYLTTNTMYNVGFVKFRLGRLEEAKVILEKVYNIQTEFSSDPSHKALNTRNLLNKIEKILLFRARDEGRSAVEVRRLYFSTRSKEN